MKKLFIVAQTKEHARWEVEKFNNEFPFLIEKKKKDKTYLLNGSVLIPISIEESLKCLLGERNYEEIAADKLMEYTYKILYENIQQRLIDASTYIAGIFLLNSFTTKHPINENTLKDIAAILDGAYRIEEQEEEIQDEI